LNVLNLSTFKDVGEPCETSFVMPRQPVPDPGGFCHGSELSIISWHLNLPYPYSNPTLTLY